MDLLQRVHENLQATFSQDPQYWGLKRPNKNIDHHRVPNLQCDVKRKGWPLPLTKEPKDDLPRDFVTVSVGGTLPYIMIVSDKTSTDGIALVIHTIGCGTQETDDLFTYPLTGHYRIKA